MRSFRRLPSGVAAFFASHASSSSDSSVLGPETHEVLRSTSLCLFIVGSGASELLSHEATVIAVPEASRQVVSAQSARRCPI